MKQRKAKACILLYSLFLLAGAVPLAVAAGTPESYIYFNGFVAGSWTNPAYAYDTLTANAATIAWSTSGYCAYLTLNLTSSCKGNLVRYWVTRSSTSITTMQIDVANQTGSWTNRYSATPTYGAYANATLSATMTYTAARFRFSKSGSSSLTACVNETMAVNAKVNVQISAPVALRVNVGTSNSRVETLARASPLTVLFSAGTSRSGAFSRPVGLDITTAFDVSRAETFPRGVGLDIIVSCATSAAQTLYRSVDQDLPVETDGSRAVSYFRTSDLIVQLITDVTSAMAYVRDASVTINVGVNPARVQTLLRPVGLDVLPEISALRQEVLKRAVNLAIRVGTYFFNTVVNYDPEPLPPPPNNNHNSVNGGWNPRIPVPNSDVKIIVPPADKLGLLDILVPVGLLIGACLLARRKK
jgi:hypothetical protein